MLRLTSFNRPRSLYERFCGSLGILSSGLGGVFSPSLGLVGSTGIT